MILNNEFDEYTKTVISMTDGEINFGNFNNVKQYHFDIESKIPVYSIIFGQPNESQLIKIANLTNSKVFDRKHDNNRLMFLDNQSKHQE